MWTVSRWCSGGSAAPWPGDGLSPPLSPVCDHLAGTLRQTGAMARGELMVLARASMGHPARHAGEERKRVLKICVSKLQTIQDPEAFLCRSVLINNTLRQIQEEHRQSQRRARLKRMRQVVEEEDREEEEEEEASAKRYCPEVKEPVPEPEKEKECPMSSSYYEVGIYKEDVLKKEREQSAIKDSLRNEIEEDDNDEVEDEEEVEEEEEDSFDISLEETPMLGSIEISVVSTTFTGEPMVKDRLSSQQAEFSEDETSSSSESSEEDSVGLHHCPYGTLLGDLQGDLAGASLPSLHCAL